MGGRHIIWFLVLCGNMFITASQVEVDGDGNYRGEMNLEELAGFGMLDSDIVMEEVQRLSGLARTEAVQAMIDGTSALAVEHQPDGLELQKHVASFEAGMLGEQFLDVDDTPSEARYRKALFIAACRTLATQARERGGE